MRDDRLLKAEVKSAIDTCLSGFDDMPSLRYDIMRKVRGETVVKKKLSVGLVLVIVLSLIVVSALAAIAIKIYSDMQNVMQLSDQGVFERWELEDKKKLIALMEQFDIEMDIEKLTILEENTADEETLDRLAGEIINSAYRERMRSRLPEWVDQPEEYPVPDYFTIFEDLWLRNAPNATEEEILAAYEQWEDGTFEQWNPEREQEMVEMEEERNNSIRTEEEMLAQFGLYLSEVKSFSKKEREKTKISAKFREDLQLWEMTLTIQIEDARPATLEQLTEYMNAFYDEKQATYSAIVYYLPNGDVLGSNLNEYLLDSLITTSEYPGDAKIGSEYRRFLEGTVAEKAAFSTLWKPKVDRWLAENPDIAQWLETDNGLYAAILCTRHVYGVPPEKAISQENALEIAQRAYLTSGNSGVSVDMLQERCSTYYFYDISDEMHPLWKISITYAAYQNPLPEDHKAGYHVILDAFTGRILDEYTWECGGNVFQVAERIM